MKEYRVRKQIAFSNEYYQVCVAKEGFARDSLGNIKVSTEVIEVPICNCRNQECASNICMAMNHLEQCDREKAGLEVK